MKPTITLLGALTLGCLFPLYAQVTETETTTDVTKNADGSVTETETKTTTTFRPEVRSKVVTFFETHKSHPHGLPPGLATKIKIKEVPMAWRTTRISPGMVIAEKERSYLVEAPPDLVEVLPAPSAGVRYYVAGSNVVAVDSGYRVVDSIQIPSIKINIDD